MAKIKKVDLKSKNIKSEQVERLKKVFPEIVADGKINFEQLKATLGEDVEDSKERFGMTWAGKSKCFRIIQDPSTGTLKPSRKESVNFDTTDNLFIEGDNLEVLKLLQKSYYEKVKMIYIDPPYNTGKDFVYTDKFGQNLDKYLKLSGQVDDQGRKLSTNNEGNGRFHSNWMNMMYPRLFLARNLLKNDGVIFISIDDNELDNLKKLCDEIFGEENFVDYFSWKKSSTPPNLSLKSKKALEYVLCYQKRLDSSKFEGIKKSSKSSNGLLNQTNSQKTLIFPANTVKTKIPNQIIKKGDSGTDNYQVKLLNDVEVKDGFFLNEFSLNAKFKWGQEKLKREIEEGTEILIQTISLSPSYEKQEYGAEIPTNLIDNSVRVSTTENAGRALKELFDGVKVFDYPKPVDLIKYLMNFSKEEDSIILDFFAGSGTTAHAVLESNKEDGLNRHFLCVQLPELTDESTEAFKAGYKTISDISKERIRRVIKKIEGESKQQKLSEDAKLDLGFRVFKLDRSNFKKWDNSTEELQTSLTEHVEQIKKTANPEEVLYEILIKDGFELTTKIEKMQLKEKDVFSIENNLLLICLDEKLDLDLFKEIKKLDPHLVIVLDKGFKDNDQLKTNAVQTLGKNSDEEYILRSI